MTEQGAEPAHFGTQIAALMVHGFTASGAVWGLLAIHAIAESRWKAAMGWMALAVLVDGSDGFLARGLDVKRVLAKIDGALLDNIVDYLNYVIVPAYLFVEANLLPPGAEWWGAAGVCVASAFQFTHVDAKTAAHYFRGFPSYWNLVACYFLLLASPPWLNLAVVVLLTALVFVPFHYIYPTRTREFRGVTFALTAAWVICMLILLADFPHQKPWLVYGSLAYVGYYIVLSAVLMWRRCT